MIDLIPANIFAGAINLLTGVGISLSVIFIMLSGIQYIVSMGNEEKAKKAKRALIHSVTGLIVVLGSVTAVYVIANTLGADIGTPSLKSFIPF